MSSSAKAYIAGVGMITPIGLNTEMTVASIKAGINRFQKSEYRNKAMNWMTMSLIPDEALPAVSHKLNPQEENEYHYGRMLLSGHVALKEALQYYPGDEPLPLFLAGPESAQKGAAAISSIFLEYLVTQTGANLDKSDSRILSTGRAGGIECLDLAIRYLHDLNKDYILVGGLDSYQDVTLLKCLDKQNRIHAEEVFNGFIPGEAAGFLLLCKHISNARVVNGKAIAIHAAGIAQEPGHLYSEEPCLGEGLTAAFKTALEDDQVNKVNAVYSSMNGEQYWTKEYGVAMARYHQYFTEQTIHEHPADCYGDIGAATGLVMSWLAGLTLATSSQEGRNLVYCSSDYSYRAAMCVSAQIC